MMTRRFALKLPALFQFQSAAGNDRQYWLSVLQRVAEPVLTALSQGKLRERMPVECVKGQETDRRNYTYLEALGRLLTGIAPWLENGPADGAEGKLRARYADLARASLAHAVNPASPDFMNFNKGAQPVVDSAFLAQAVIRAPKELWEKLPAQTKAQLVQALQSSRTIQPGFNNWLLFSAMVEAFFCRVGADWDKMRVDYAIRQHEQWFKGDGIYGDGPQFHWDYYSFVIQPMLLEILEVTAANKTWDNFRAPMLQRAQRYAAIQERLISPEGTFPAVGRSLTYRFGAFQLLALMALRKQLPAGVAPEQVRPAMTAVIRRLMEAPGTFDANGWLTIGFCGHQPFMGETYISTGSLYLCAAGLLPLGLPLADPFWSGAAKKWTSQRVYSGEDVRADHAG